MNNPNAALPPAPGLTLGDIYYVLFRQKKKIIAISALGIVAAALVYFEWPVPYSSQARLLVKYVVDTKTAGQDSTAAARVRVPDERGGDTVINTEVSMLTSFDIAKDAAEKLALDPSVVNGRTNALDAIDIAKGLQIRVTNKSDVIDVLFSSSDRNVVQPTLTKVIDAYLDRQAKVHGGIGVYDEYLRTRRDQLNTALSATVEDLQKAKASAGILSMVDDSKKAYADEMSRIREALITTESDLAESRARLEVEQASLRPMNAPAPTNAASPSSSGASPVTNATSLAAISNSAPVSVAIASEYKQLNTRLDTLSKQEDSLLVQFSPQSVMVKNVHAQLTETETRLRKLEEENPGLIASKLAESRSITTYSGGSPSPANPSRSFDILDLMARVAGLQKKAETLTNRLALVTEWANKLSESEGRINDFQRSKEAKERDYNYFLQALEELKADQAVNAARNNIAVIQQPTGPFQDKKKVTKAAIGILAAGFALAFGLAFLLEFYVDQSIKRPLEVESKVGLPLLLTVPRLAINGHGKARLLTEGSEKSSSGADPGAKSPSGRAGEQSPDTYSSPELRPYHEALRDRLITYFEVKNLTHKPKLVAVTSCAEGAGVSTTAAGLAASLSNTGDGNVLLVDMNREGSSRQFSNGNPECGLDDALEVEKRDGAMVQENLYVVRESPTNDKLPYALPRRFKHLVPRLKASDYDYIIFDLPPISQISVTSRLARFMDMALIVVEAEQTDGDVVKRAGKELALTGANVGIVLNKSRDYLPKRLSQEL